MQKELANKGVLIVALTDEPTGKVAPFVKQNNMNYIVGAGARDTLKEYGIRGFPTLYVIDPDGTIAYVGHSPFEAEKTVEKLRAERPPTRMSLASGAGSGALAKADKLYKQEKYNLALREYQKIAKSQKDTDAGRKAKSRIEKMKADEQIMASVRQAETRKKCTNWLDTARLLAKQGKSNDALKYYQRVIKEYPDSEFALTANQEIGKLKD